MYNFGPAQACIRLAAKSTVVYMYINAHIRKSNGCRPIALYVICRINKIYGHYTSELHYFTFRWFGDNAIYWSVNAHVVK